MNIVNKQITNPIAILHKPIIHHSLTTGSVPNYMKLATITPILNKSNSTSFSVANYHPISNLSTHSKILERVVSKQLSAYMISIKIPSIFQRPTYHKQIHWNSTYHDHIKLTIQTQQHPRTYLHSTWYVFDLRYTRAKYPSA